MSIIYIYALFSFLKYFNSFLKICTFICPVICHIYLPFLPYNSFESFPGRVSLQTLCPPRFSVYCPMSTAQEHAGDEYSVLTSFESKALEQLKRLVRINVRPGTRKKCETLCTLHLTAHCGFMQVIMCA